MGIASLVLGIVSIAFIFMPWSAGLGVLIGAAGIVLAVLARKNGEKGIATAGLVCSIVGAAICGIMYIACAQVENAAESLTNSAVYYR